MSKHSSAKQQVLINTCGVKCQVTVK